MIVDGGRMMMKTDQGKGKDGGFGLRRRKTGRGWVDTERREGRECALNWPEASIK